MGGDVGSAEFEGVTVGWTVVESESTSGGPLTECRGRRLPLPSERVKSGGSGIGSAATSFAGGGCASGRPLTDFGRRRPNLPLPLERVNSGGSRMRVVGAVWAGLDLGGSGGGALVMGAAVGCAWSAGLGGV